MKKLLKMTLLAFACFFVFGLAACGDSSENETTEYKGTMEELLAGSDVDVKYLEYKAANDSGKIDKTGANYTITGLKDGYPLGIKIPETIDGKTVIAIESSAFAITDVVLVSVPGTVKVIGNNAFSSSNLKEINFRESNGTTALTTLGKKVFTSTDLVEITLPDTVTVIGDELFGGSQKLKKATLPSSITKIPSKCFNNCGVFTTLEASGVTEIGEEAFRGTGLTEFVVSDSVTSIEKLAFAYCTKLTNITLSSKVTAIKESTFDGCTSLESIELPKSVTQIGKYAFRNCSSLKTIKINGPLTSVVKGAFANCLKVEELSYVANSTFAKASDIFVNEAYPELPTALTTLRIDGDNGFLNFDVLGTLKTVENVYISNSRRLGGGKDDKGNLTYVITTEGTAIENIYIEGITRAQVNTFLANDSVTIHVDVTEEQSSGFVEGWNGGANVVWKAE